MSPTRRLLIGAVVVIAGTLGYAAGRGLFRPSERVVQPIAFNHEKHVDELGMACSDCHAYYETAEHSGLPSLSLCLGCHEGAPEDQPELRKIEELHAAGHDDAFRKLFRLADHTTYSHRRHVAVAGLSCETCHGPVAATTVPPERPLIRIDMDFCLDCHRASSASLDCTACHR